ncbi:hypothetical protein [Roseiflexus sp.]|uniref:hypothetical protein n=1 Tax=Roseiflexus sp. TaxID=2562120 RepID=UPI00258A8BA7|nr:hypothetical protein [Roseiflexus sp.]
MGVAPAPIRRPPGTLGVWDARQERGCRARTDPTPAGNAGSAGRSPGARVSRPHRSDARRERWECGTLARSAGVAPAPIRRPPGTLGVRDARQERGCRARTDPTPAGNAGSAGRSPGARVSRPHRSDARRERWECGTLARSAGVAPAPIRRPPGTLGVRDARQERGCRAQAM